MSELQKSRLGLAIGQYMNTLPFWEATREQRLLMQFCTQSQRWQPYPRPGSVYTGRRQLEWREVSGKGVVASWTVDRMNTLTAGPVSRIHALVDLAEGVRLLSWLVECEPAQLRTGLPVRVEWVALGEGLQWPAFTSLKTVINK